MLFILHTVPVAFGTYSQLVGDSVTLLTEQLNIEVVTGEPKSQKGAGKMVGDILSKVNGL